MDSKTPVNSDPETQPLLADEPSSAGPSTSPKPSRSPGIQQPASPQPQEALRPLVDIEPLDSDPTRAELELIAGPDKDEYQDDESHPLLPPPAFQDYEAEYEQNKAGDITSHDRHLNEDGEALYRFLLQHASERPKLLLHCRGAHTEWRTRQVTRYEDGRNVSSTETYSETIVDFDFNIDASDAILPAGCPTNTAHSHTEDVPIWVVGDKDATYRGRRRLEVDSPPKVLSDTNPPAELDIEPGRGPRGKRSWRRKATDGERKASEAWRERRAAYGYAPWVLVRGQIRGQEASVESSNHRASLVGGTRAAAENQAWFDDTYISPPSKTLRDWADEYCASRRYLKEFVFKKVIYGWNMGALQSAVESCVQANYLHRDDLVIAFQVDGTTITIKPDNWFSRMLDRTWMLVLLWLTLVYPFVIWPYKTWGKRGGGQWHVAGSAFALTKWVHQEDSDPGETVDAYQRRIASTSSTSEEQPLLKATARGISKLVGTREGVWFGRWEETIGSLVRQRYQGGQTLTRPLGSDGTAGIGLDGYYPTLVREHTGTSRTPSANWLLKRTA